MQIHEITQQALKEGLLGDVGRSITQGLTGFEIPPSQAEIDADAARSAEKLRAKGYTVATNPQAPQRITVSLTQPGQSVPSKYFKIGNKWTNEIGAEITDLAQKLYLDKLIPTHGRKELLPPTTPDRKTVSRRRNK